MLAAYLLIFYENLIFTDRPISHIYFFVGGVQSRIGLQPKWTRGQGKLAVQACWLAMFPVFPFPTCQGRQSWRVGVATPIFWTGESWGSWTGREILLYVIMYWKYVRKRWLLERNRIILHRSSCKWPIFAWKIEFLVKLLEKLKFFENLPAKVEIFYTRINDPQISNQIDAAKSMGKIMNRNSRFGNRDIGYICWRAVFKFGGKELCRDSKWWGCREFVG